MPKKHPATTVAVVGLGWGLAFGLLDGLPALLEGNPATDLGRRLLALTYVAVWDAVAFGLILAFVGLAVWGIAKVTRRQVSHADLLGLSVGLCAALSTAAYLVHRFQDTPWIVIVALALAVGIVAGWPARSVEKPGFWSRAIVGAFAVAVVVLLGRVLFHQFIRDLPVFNPRVTDQAATPERPNVVLISIDALRADRLGIYGNDPAVSTRIDELARQGLVFQQATSQGSSTVPSVSSFLTSLYPTEVGIITGQEWGVDDARITLAEALQVAGYRTQAYVTNGHLVASSGYAQGFDGYVSPEPGRSYGLDRLRAETVVAGLACRHHSP